MIAPVMPFITDHLWAAPRSRRRRGRAGPVHLARWPEVTADSVDDELLASMEEARLVAELGRRARDASGLKLRQPVRRLVVAGARRAEPHADVVRDELRVKELEWATSARRSCASSRTCRCSARSSGRSWAPRRRPRRGGVRGAARRRVRSGRARARPGRGARGARRPRGLGGRVREGVTVALDTELDDELRPGRPCSTSSTSLNLMRRRWASSWTDRIVVSASAVRSGSARPRRLDQERGAGGRARAGRRSRRAADRQGLRGRYTASGGLRAGANHRSSSGSTTST